MVDAGSGPSSPWRYREVADRIVLPYLAHARIRRLDALILSHADSDHSSGMAGILREVDVGQFIINNPPAQDQAAAQAACVAARQRGIEPTVVRRGGVIRIDDDVVVSVLHPPTRWCENEAVSENNRSLVLHLTYGQVSFLLPGDIEADAEQELLHWARSQGLSLRSSVLVLPHHGSNTSSTDALLDAVRPSLAVVCGARAQSRPAHSVVIERLRRRGIPLVSTDMLGTVELITDGTDLHWRSYHEPYSRERASSSWQSTTAWRNCSAVVGSDHEIDRWVAICAASRRARLARTPGSSWSRLSSRRRAA